MSVEPLVDFFADPPAIHVNGEIAIAADIHRSVRVLVGQPAETAARPGSWCLEKRPRLLLCSASNC